MKKIINCLVPCHNEQEVLPLFYIEIQKVMQQIHWKNMEIPNLKCRLPEKQFCMYLQPQVTSEGKFTGGKVLSDGSDPQNAVLFFRVFY